MTTLIPKFDRMNGGTTPLYAINRTISEKLADFVSVLDFNADPTGVADSSNAITSAIATGKAVYFPKGTYLCNISINNKTILYGDGSTVSIIKPFVYTAPAMIYTYAAMQNPVFGFWNYHSVVKGLSFQGTGTGVAATGIGFSFGTGSPSTYTTGAEYANNVTFYDCFFSKLKKGVQFPFGNIGSAFYSCGFQGNYYGVYMLDNKSGQGDAMHAGCKYFYNGEMSGNVCAVYINNSTQGFGAVAFTDTIFESNNLAIYAYDSQTYSPSNPIQFKDCWNEANGTASGATTATIDLWTGNTVTTQTVNSYPYTFYSSLVAMDGGIVTGINLLSPSSQVYVTNSKVEITSGYGGQNMAVTSNTSRIYFENCHSASGYSIGVPQAICKGVNYSIDPTVGISQISLIGSRSKFLPLGFSVNSSSGVYGNKVTFVGAQAYTGASTGTGTVISDGIKFATCNQYTYNFTSTSQYIWPTATVTSLSGGYWAYTVDIKVTAGSPLFLLGDLANNQMARFTVPADSTWHTVGGVALLNNTASVFLAAGGVVTNATWEYSGFQLYNFATYGDAEEFIASRTYLG